MEEKKEIDKEEKEGKSLLYNLLRLVNIVYVKFL